MVTRRWTWGGGAALAETALKALGVLHNVFRGPALHDSVEGEPLNRSHPGRNTGPRQAQAAVQRQHLRQPLLSARPTFEQRTP